MNADPSASHALPDAALAGTLARMWPHRAHESSAVTGLLCRIGLHFWRQLDVSHVAPNRKVRFCFWCTKVSIDGVHYEP